MRLNLPPIEGLEPGQAAAALNPHAGVTAGESPGLLTVAIGDRGSIVARSSAGRWGEMSATLQADATPGDVARFNRLISGWGDPIKVEKNWRSPHQLRVIGAGGPIDLPARIIANRGGAWVGANIAATTAPTALTSAAIVAPTPPVLTPPAVTAPVVAPVAPVTPPKGGAAKGPGVLPAVHPGIFREGVGSAVRMHLTDDVTERLDAAFQAHREGIPQFLLLRGPSGAGKTQAVFAKAAEYGYPTFTAHVAGLRDFADWAGQVNLSESGGVTVTQYIPSQLMEACSVDGPYAGIPRLVLFDEITRAETPGALNAATSITDHQRSLYIPDARMTKYIDPAVMFAATANIGAEFTGTNELDAAIANRVTGWVRVTYTPPETEARIITEQTGCTAEQAAQLVRIAKLTRDMAERLEIKVAVSTRVLVATGHWLAGGMSPARACLYGFGDYYSEAGGNDSDLFKVTGAIGSIVGGL